MIKYRFKELTAKFYKENGIDKNDVKETINYDCTLEDLYEQLLKIRDKYGKEIIIKKLLETETEKYKKYVGYDEIANRIENCINDIFSKIKYNGFNYTQKDINDMHIEIEQIFKTYYILFKKISELENIVNTIENQEIINYYELIERNFYGGIPYSEFDEHIKELEDLIDKYQKENQRKINFKNNEQVINKIYQLLITRYSETLKDYNIITDYKIINDYNNLLNQVLEAFAKGCEEFKNLEYFNQFNQFTFKNLAVENTIIENMLRDSKQKSNDCKIYIKRKDKAKRLFDETSFFYFDKDKMQIYLLGSQTIIKENINQQELDKDYISLDELLSISKYLGKWMINENNFYRIYIYYHADGYIIYQNPNDERIHILVNPPEYFRTDYDNKKIISDEMKDKKTIQDLIEKQLQHRIDEYNQQQERKNNTHSTNDYSKTYKNIYGEPVYNYNDSYGYNEPAGPRRR